MLSHLDRWALCDLWIKCFRCKWRIMTTWHHWPLPVQDHHHQMLKKNQLIWWVTPLSHQNPQSRAPDHLFHPPFVFEMSEFMSSNASLTDMAASRFSKVKINVPFSYTMRSFSTHGGYFDHKAAGRVLNAQTLIWAKVASSYSIPACRLSL